MRIMKRRHTRFSSVEAVPQCEELVNEILLRLPLDAVCKFKCVSKTWNSLISHPLFCSNYLSQRKNSLLPLLGFFRINYYGATIESSFLQNCKEKKFTSLGFFEDYVLTYVSPEGLILCSLNGNMVLKYYVCNPVTNQWLTLPEPRHAPFSVALSCEEYCSSKDGDGVVHFKVTLAIMENRVGATYDGLHLETFSSRTGEWSGSFITSPSEFSDVDGESHRCHSAGGILYWKFSSGHLAAYDPNMGENRLWLIELPPPCLKKRKGFYMEYALGQSSSREGCLLRFATNEDYIIRVLELKKKLSTYTLSRIIPSSEWVLKEEVSLKKLCVGNFLPHVPPHTRLKEFHPRDANLLYLKRGSMMFCYDFETRRLEGIQYSGTALPKDTLVPYFQPPWRPSLPCLTWT